WRPGLQFLLLFGPLGDTVFVLVARPYWIAATSSRVVMFNAGRFWPKCGKQVFEAPLDVVRTEKLGGGPLRRRIRLRALAGSDHQLAVHRGYWKELDRLTELVAGVNP